MNNRFMVTCPKCKNTFMYDFKEREKDIISMIKKRPELTYQEIADLSSVALSTVKAIAARHRVRRYKRKDDND